MSVVNIQDGVERVPATEEIERLTFLKDEGLEILALYKRIEDAETRAAILVLLKAMTAKG